MQKSHEPTTKGAIRRHRRRPWPMTAVALMLLAEAVALGVLAWWLIEALEPPGGHASFERIVEVILSSISRISVFVLIALTALYAIFTNLRRWPSAWNTALFVQGFMLLTGLILYFREQVWYAYPILIVGLVETVYLITPGVQAAFLPPRHEISDTVVQGPSIHPRGPSSQ